MIVVQIRLPICLWFALIALSTGGCIGRTPVPLTDQTLDTMTRTRIEEATVSDGTTRSVALRNDEIPLFRNLMARLGPITSVEKKEIGEYDVEMAFLGGRDPGIIKIKMHPELPLQFQWGPFLYTGGSSKDFRMLADQILSLRETRDN
jgi:hypothetical protein